MFNLLQTNSTLIIEMFNFDSQDFEIRSKIEMFIYVAWPESGI